MEARGRHAAETYRVCMCRRGHVCWQVCLCACSETKKKESGGWGSWKNESLLKDERRCMGKEEEDDLAPRVFGGLHGGVVPVHWLRAMMAFPHLPANCDGCTVPASPLDQSNPRSIYLRGWKSELLMTSQSSCHCSSCKVGKQDGCARCCCC